MIKKNIQRHLNDYRCPLCNVLLQGTFTGQSLVMTCEFGESVTYELFRFGCPKCQRLITMMTASHMKANIFWPTRDEYTIEEPCKVKRLYFNPSCAVTGFYLYHPVTSKMDVVYDNFRKAIGEQRFGTKFVLYTSLSYMKTLPEDIEKRMVMVNVLPDMLWLFVKGTKYPSIPAELCITSDIRQHGSRNELISFYPTAMKEFKIVGCDDINWSGVEQMATV